MLFQFNITLTEEDYLAFNNFHSFESKQGKKLIRKTRISFIAVMVFLMALVILLLGWRPFTITYVTLLGLLTIVYMLTLKKRLIRSIKKQIKRLKETGKLPFDPSSTLEFYDDKMVEISPSARTELRYDIIERICVVADRYILLYRSSVTCNILPIAQINAQADMDAFLNFISQKCNTIERY